MKVTQEQLKLYVSYAPMTGIFTRIKALGNQKARWENKPTGSVSGNGYILIGLLGRQVQAHRLAWLYMTGNLPKQDIDHINGNKKDNRWENLRDVSRAENLHNQRKSNKNNISGYLGVSVKRSKYQARIVAEGKCQSLGVFDTPEEAHEAYIKAKRELHSGYVG